MLAHGAGLSANHFASQARLRRPERGRRLLVDSAHDVDLAEPLTVDGGTPQGAGLRTKCRACEVPGSIGDQVFGVVLLTDQSTSKRLACIWAYSTLSIIIAKFSRREDITATSSSPMIVVIVKTYSGGAYFDCR